MNRGSVLCPGGCHGQGRVGQARVQSSPSGASAWRCPQERLREARVVGAG